MFCAVLILSKLMWRVMKLIVECTTVKEWTGTEAIVGLGQKSMLLEFMNI